MTGDDLAMPRLVAVIERQRRELDRIRAAAAAESVVAMARGALMERLGLSATEAAAQLAELSEATGVPLRRDGGRRLVAARGRPGRGRKRRTATGQRGRGRKHRRSDSRGRPEAAATRPGRARAALAACRDRGRAGGRRCRARRHAGRAGAVAARRDRGRALAARGRRRARAARPGGPVRRRGQPLAAHTAAAGLPGAARRTRCRRPVVACGPRGRGLRAGNRPAGRRQGGTRAARAERRAARRDGDELAGADRGLLRGGPPAPVCARCGLRADSRHPPRAGGPGRRAAEGSPIHPARRPGRLGARAQGHQGLRRAGGRLQHRARQPRLPRPGRPGGYRPDRADPA